VLRSLPVIAFSPLFTSSCRDSSGPQEHVAALVRALHQVQAAPANAREICLRLEDPPSQGECIISAVEKLSRKAPKAARALCSELTHPTDADECYFQVAERSGNVEWCADAGDFAFDCRIHLWTSALSTLPAPIKEAEAWAQAKLPSFGFHPNDIRPWEAFSMVLLRRELPLDRATCQLLATAERQVACKSSGVAVYRDRLRWQIDSLGLPCPGASLNPTIDPGRDPELLAILEDAQRAIPCEGLPP
jgi:hypothetical protein